MSATGDNLRNTSFTGDRIQVCAGSMFVIADREDLTETGFYRLMTNTLFIDYFNVFLSLPERDKSRMLSWLYFHRLLFFVQTDLYAEYTLCKQLLERRSASSDPLRIAKELSSSEKSKVWPTASDVHARMQSAIGGASRMRSFKQYLADGPGRKLYELWMEIERFFCIPSSDQRSRWLKFREIQIIFHDFQIPSLTAANLTNTGVHTKTGCTQLDGHGFVECRLFATAGDGHVTNTRQLVSSLHADDSLDKDMLCNGSSQLRSLQRFLVVLLADYWLAKYALHCEAKRWATMTTPPHASCHKPRPGGSVDEKVKCETYPLMGGITTTDAYHKNTTSMSNDDDDTKQLKQPKVTFISPASRTSTSHCIRPTWLPSSGLNPSITRLDSSVSSSVLLGGARCPRKPGAKCEKSPKSTTYTSRRTLDIKQVGRPEAGGDLRSGSTFPFADSDLATLQVDSVDLYERAVVTDRAAGGPFKAYLVESECIAAKRVLDFWFDAQIWLLMHSSRDTNVQSLIRARRACALMLRYLSGDADKQICLFKPALRSSLQRLLVNDQGNDLVKDAQRIALEHLRPLWDVYRHQDISNFRKIVTCSQRGPNGFAKTSKLNLGYDVTPAGGTTVDGSDESLYVARWRCKLAFQLAVEVTYFCVDGSQHDDSWADDDVPDSCHVDKDDLEYSSLAVNPLQVSQGRESADLILRKPWHYWKNNSHEQAKSAPKTAKDATKTCSQSIVRKDGKLQANKPSKSGNGSKVGKTNNTKLTGQRGSKQGNRKNNLVDDDGDGKTLQQKQGGSKKKSLTDDDVDENNKMKRKKQGESKKTNLSGDVDDDDDDDDDVKSKERMQKKQGSQKNGLDHVDDEDNTNKMRKKQDGKKNSDSDGERNIKADVNDSEKKRKTGECNDAETNNVKSKDLPGRGNGSTTRMDVISGPGQVLNGEAQKKTMAFGTPVKEWLDMCEQKAKIKTCSSFTEVSTGRHVTQSCESCERSTRTTRNLDCVRRVAIVAMEQCC